MLQPGASVRPVITNRSCTEPSATPLLFLKRASRAGPFCVTNQGTVFFAPFKVATAIWGFCAGLDPPAPGCEWQDKHWFELKRGPRPLFVPLVTASVSANRASPSWKNAVSSAVRPFSGPPAPAGPPRTPGSTGADLVCPNALTPMVKATATIPPKPLHTTPRSVITITLLELGRVGIVHQSGGCPRGKAKDRTGRLVQAQNCRRADNRHLMQWYTLESVPHVGQRLPAVGSLLPLSRCHPFLPKNSYGATVSTLKAA